MDYRNVIVGLTWAAFLCVFDFAEGRTLGDLIGGLLKYNVPNQNKSATSHGGKKNTFQITSSPFVTRIKDISLVSADLMHGDYVGASLDGVYFLETYDNFQWPIKLALKIMEIILKIIHPIFLRIFPDAKNNGDIIESLMYSVSRSGGILKTAMKIMSSLSN